MIKYTFMFTCIDNSGKYQVFTVKAPNKQVAIDKGFAKARQNALGDIGAWDCRLQFSY